MNSSWDFSTQNWTASGLGSVFTNGDNVSLGSAANNDTVVINAGSVNPNNVNIDATGLSISSAGAGDTLSIGGGLTVNAGGSATFSALTTVNGAFTNSGTFTLDANLTLGAASSNFGTLNINSDLLGSGALTSSGTVVVGGATIANDFTQTGTTTISGASTFNGAFTQSAGSTTVSAASTFANGFTNGSIATLTISAQTTLGAASSNTGTLDINAAVVGGQQITNTGTATIGANITGSYVQNSSGSASTTIDGASTISGLVDIDTGSLAVNFGQTLTATTGVDIAAGATGSVDGTVVGDVFNGGGLVISSGGTINGSVTSTGNTDVQSGGQVTGTLTNSGTGSGSAGTVGGLSSTAGTFSNSGTVSGTTTVSGGTVTNTGTLSGFVTVTGGTLEQNGGTLSSGVTIDGGTADIRGGTIASLTSLSGTTSITGGSVSGATTVDGGTVNFDSAILAGAITVNGGTFNALGGSLGGMLTMTGGTLAGAGSVGQVVANGGSIAPGVGGIGTLSTTGDVTFNSGSTFSVEVDPAGQSDLLDVTGAVTITSTGTTLDITGLGTNYPTLSPNYTVLSATGGITGQFATVQDDLPDLDFAATYNTNDVVLTYTAATEESPKEVIGSSVSSATTATSSYIQGLTARTQSLDVAGFDRIGDSFEALGYTAQGGHEEAWMEHVNGVSGAESAHGLGMWGSLEAAGVDVSNQGSVTGFDATTFGFATGMEYRGTVGAGSNVASTVFGAAIGISTTETTSGASTSQTENYQFGLYGGAQFDRTTVAAALAVAYHDFDMQRVIALGGGGTSTAAGDTDGISFAGTLEISHRLFEAGGTGNEGQYSHWFGPIATADFVLASQDGYTETGAGVLNLVVDDTTHHQGVFGLGLTAGTQWSTEDHTLQLSGRLLWEHVVGDLNGVSSSAIQATPTVSFVSESAEIGANRAALELVAGLALNDHLTFSLGYDGRISPRDHSHRGELGMSLRF